MHVKLGNHAPVDNGHPLDFKSVTEFNIPNSYSLLEALRAIADTSGGAWAYHSKDEAPAWVWSDNESLQSLLAEHYHCEVGIPENVEDEYYTTTPPGVRPQESAE